VKGTISGAGLAGGTGDGFALRGPCPLVAREPLTGRVGASAVIGAKERTGR
jgi:hypothetical protein